VTLGSVVGFRYSRLRPHGHVLNSFKHFRGSGRIWRSDTPMEIDRNFPGWSHFNRSHVLHWCICYGPPFSRSSLSWFTLNYWNCPSALKTWPRAGTSKKFTKSRRLSDSALDGCKYDVLITNRRCPILLSVISDYRRIYLQNPLSVHQQLRCGTIWNSSIHPWLSQVTKQEIRQQKRLIDAICVDHLLLGISGKDLEWVRGFWTFYRCVR
jgi:hypothetical protein